MIDFMHLDTVEDIKNIEEVRHKIIDVQIAEEVSQFYDDPYGFVMWAFNWDEGELLGFSGPDVWQMDVLNDVGREVRDRAFNGVDPVKPIREATASGHGVGKSALTAWLILWIMSTRMYAKGVVTANTSDQLKTKTWSEVGKWLNRSIMARWFEYNNSKGNMHMYHTKYPESWRVDAQTCREENSESFAGLHSAQSTPFYIFDEACHDDKTEVLSDEGWKLFKDVKPSDRLLTMDTTTMQSYYDTPSHLYVSKYSGDLVVVNSPDCSYAVTPNHRMLYQSNSVKELQFQTADSHDWNDKKMVRHIEWDGEHVNSYTVPLYESKGDVYRSRTVPMHHWLKFLGWFITNGHILKQTWFNTEGKPEVNFTGVIVIQKQNNVNELEQCLDFLDFKYTRQDTDIFIHEVALGAHLHTSLEDVFNGECLPSYLFNLTPAQIHMFLNATVKSNGYKPAEVRVLHTRTNKLAEDYNRLALLTGVSSKVTNNGNNHKVIINNEQYYTDYSKLKPVKQPYDGNIYCATISGGVLYTRHNGHAMWSGNSAVPDNIWEVAEGGLTDGEPMFFVFGNPTRNSGSFAEIFKYKRHIWNTRQIDSRDAKMTNKELFKEWAIEYGEDSDFFRVRVRGVFPRASETQFIPGDKVSISQTCTPRYMGDDLLICGVDVARGGGDESVVQFRRGLDARSETVYKIPAEKSRDSMQLISILATIFKDHRPDIINVDETGLGGPIVDRLNQMGYIVNGINFGQTPDDPKHYVNKISEMWARMREWIIKGGAIHNDMQLELELTDREYKHNEADQLVIESKNKAKKDGTTKRDWSDALALTFAIEVPKIPYDNGRMALDDIPGKRDTKGNWDYNPLDNL